MGYYNSIFCMGHEIFCDKLISAGGSGFIVADLPIEQSTELDQFAKAMELDHIQVITPVDTDSTHQPPVLERVKWNSILVAGDSRQSSTPKPHFSIKQSTQSGSPILGMKKPLNRGAVPNGFMVLRVESPLAWRRPSLNIVFNPTHIVNNMVGVRGFEPPASASRTQRATPALHPDPRPLYSKNSSGEPIRRPVAVAQW